MLLKCPTLWRHPEALLDGGSAAAGQLPPLLEGARVDLLIERHGRLRLAVEIKAKRRVAGADLSGLRSFADAHPRVRRVVVAEVPEPYRLGDVDILPYRAFLDQLPRLVR